MISCDVDLGNEKCMAMWRYYCRTYTADVSIKFPNFDDVRRDTRLERADTQAIRLVVSENDKELRCELQ